MSDGTPVFLVRALAQLASREIVPGAVYLDNRGGLYRANGGDSDAGLSGFSFGALGSLFSKIGSGFVSFGKSASGDAHSALTGWLNIGQSIGGTLLQNRGGASQPVALTLQPYQPEPQQQPAPDPQGLGGVPTWAWVLLATAFIVARSR
jgi:hypothetical protein